ncbi:class D beta-lactamase [Albimonas pacifica]|uniref:Beta-lactamase class D n=1 Tax=Albimonas pacifica TaxID=1114924 RepID=A0A1I3IT91_9RHOB|nr:class D beta-lactamase [Albimonas pacifica]SFI51165.1 beta-lactamase class D [Albimonas pacifica]
MTLVPTVRRLVAALAPALAAVCAALAAPVSATPVCTLVIDAADGAALVEEGDCRARATPASTFKIPLAAMGFEAGLLDSPRSPVMAFRPGDADWGGEAWRRDTDPAAWMRHSVVWYSQRITRVLGAETLTRQARAFGYGNADFSGDPGFDNGLERAWIASSLQVSPHEQAAFLRALVRDALPISAEAMRLTRAIVETRQVDGWTLHGKTGGAFPRRADRSFDYARGWGWYVGWAQRGAETRVFAVLTQATERTGVSPGVATRDALLRRWPELAAAGRP